MKPTIRSRITFRGEQCLNCETPLDVADTYCHRCGQLNSTKRLALKDFIEEFFANIISYDSKLWRTITQLITRPGFVTLEYCAGKRSRYANPFRFFLTVSIVFFLLLQFSVQFSNDKPIATTNKMKAGIFEYSFENDSLSEKEMLEILKYDRDSATVEKNKLEKMILNNNIEVLEKQFKDKEKTKNYTSQKELDKLDFVSRYMKQIENYSNYASDHPQESPESALKNLNHRISNKNIVRYKKGQNLNLIQDNPMEMVNIILPRVPLFLFFFAPIVSLFFSLVYIRGKWNYMEHMVFNFHLLTFIFLILFVVFLEDALINTSIVGTLFFTIIGPIYLYKALRKFYQQNRFKTILKFLFINFVFFTLLIFSSALFIIGSVFLNV